MTEKFEPKLLILDCDGVLYHPSELDINAMVYAFNDVCEDLGLKEEKFNYIENCTQDKPIKGIYDYIGYVAKKVGIKTDDFILKMVNHVDYSHIKTDKCEILQKCIALNNKYKICICTNNHTEHTNQVLKAKFNIMPSQLPFEIFDTRFAELEGKFYPKESPLFVSKLEEHFKIKSCNFLWIDDNPKVIEKVKSFGSQAILVTEQNPLSDILKKLDNDMEKEIVK